MIKLDRHRVPDILLDLTPLVDMVFLLLVFFLLTSSMAGRALEIDLPEAESAEVLSLEVIKIFLDQRGGIYVNEHHVTGRNIEAVLRDSAQGNPELGIVLYADRGVPFERVVGVLDKARSAGIEKVTVATMPASVKKITP